ncbi:MAG: hypothetical protein WD602_07130 [Actinomycetota bacterium]
MKLLLMLVMTVCAAAIVYVLSQGAAQTYEVGGMVITGTRAVAAAGLTLCGAAVLFGGLMFVSMLKTAVWLGGALIAVGLAMGVLGSPAP